MVYRLLISSVLVLQCTSMTAMSADGKKTVGTARASYETMKEAYEFRIEQLKSKITELEQNQTRAKSEQEMMGKLNNVEQQLSQLTISIQALRPNPPSIVSVPERLLARYYGCVKRAESNAIQATASYKDFIENGSGTYLKDSNELKGSNTALYSDFLSNPLTKKIFTQHPDFLKLCETIKHLKSRIAQLEIPLEKSDRIFTFIQKGYLLSSIINSFDATLEEVKK